MEKQLTLCIIHVTDSVLLGVKKRGFGVGLWNGFGGKVEENETIEEAVRRELLEEARLVADDLTKLGILKFHFLDQEDVLITHVYKCTTYSGVPKEGEEMRPQWFLIDEIPFENMWKDDIFWFPYFLKNELFTGEFTFDSDNEIVRSLLQRVKAF